MNTSKTVSKPLMYFQTEENIIIVSKEWGKIPDIRDVSPSAMPIAYKPISYEEMDHINQKTAIKLNKTRIK